MIYILKFIMILPIFSTINISIFKCISHTNGTKRIDNGHPFPRFVIVLVVKERPSCCWEVGTTSLHIFFVFMVGWSGLLSSFARDSTNHVSFHLDAKKFFWNFVTVALLFVFDN
jgi:hypothetical protein